MLEQNSGNSCGNKDYMFSYDEEHKWGAKAGERTQKSSANKDEYEQYRKLAESTIEKGDDSRH
ncbi:hypothetical protein GcM1_146003 [Golovinomyces cichoracearum]|uniref:Uncharacterized protein n=1 Tax=Golovinomyces cichoracearum TaxID=62708 RepID=A0A420JB74_9PEZI|nr:hypothetical protein GcM1_146003 [Golovinomyces cichoracearum]